MFFSSFFFFDFTHLTLAEKWQNYTSINSHFRQVHRFVCARSEMVRNVLRTSGKHAIHRLTHSSLNWSQQEGLSAPSIKQSNRRFIANEYLISRHNCSLINLHSHRGKCDIIYCYLIKIKSHETFSSFALVYMCNLVEMLRGTTCACAHYQHYKYYEHKQKMEKTEEKNETNNSQIYTFFRAHVSNIDGQSAHTHSVPAELHAFHFSKYRNKLIDFH